MPYKDPERSRDAKRRSYRKHREEILNQSRAKRTEWTQEQRDDHAARARSYREKNRLELRAYNRAYYAKYTNRLREKANERAHQDRENALSAYGRKCACCGETTYQFLAVDHLYKSGPLSRKSTGSGADLYRWLRQNSYPGGFRVLCHNCNLAMGFYGECPHKGVRA